MRNNIEHYKTASNIRGNAKHPANKPSIRKRHWCLGSAIIFIGSWITHTTTATVYEDFSNQQALKFSQSIPSNSATLNGGLPDELFIDTLKTAYGPISDNTISGLSLSKHIFAAPKEPLSEKTYTIKRGDTLGGIFKKLDLDLSLPYKISQHDIGKQLKALSIGKTLIFRTNEQDQLKEIDYPISALKELQIKLQGQQLLGAEISDLPFKTRQRSVSGEINSSLYEAAIDAGLSISLVMDMVQIFGWDIDFVLDIRSGDSFHVVFEEHHINGNALTEGNILAAEFTTQGETFQAIRFEDSDGVASYYNPQGESMLGTFLRSPVEFSRISSRFGKRKHPILKTWRAHKGVDYAAGRGTPIRATADGKVVHAGSKGGYGKTVILRHAGRFTTLYGHMNGYAKNTRTGSRVKQGDVIGYIGSTGLATGPHLHYEFRLDGVHRNPLTFKTPKASAVNTAHQERFNSLSKQMIAQLRNVASEYELAKSSDSRAQNSEAY